MDQGSISKVLLFSKSKYFKLFFFGSFELWCGLQNFGLSVVGACRTSRLIRLASFRRIFREEQKFYQLFSTSIFSSPSLSLYCK